MDHGRLFGDYQEVVKHILFRKCHYVEICGRKSRLTTENMQYLMNNIDLKYGLLIRCWHPSGFDKELVSDILYLVNDLKNFF